MRPVRRLLLVCVAVFLIIGYASQYATAIGRVKELPFIGTYRVTCGYHNGCYPGQETDGFGLDFVNQDTVEGTRGRVAYASGDGTVTTSGGDPNVGYGYQVVIRHPDSLYSRYAHLDWFFPAVNHKMQLGSPIGYMGSTGKSTGAHLHWQVYQNTPSGPGVDPRPIEGVDHFCTWRDTGACEPSYTNTGFSTPMRLVDNTDSGFSSSGTATCWPNNTNGFHRSGLGKAVTYYVYCNGTTGSATRIGTWVPSLPTMATYWIYVFIPNHKDITLTGSARYEVYSDGRLLYSVSINQNAYNNDWVRLGSAWMGYNPYVRLTNQTSDGQKVAYDAVMFVQDF